MKIRSFVLFVLLVLFAAPSFAQEAPKPAEATQPAEDPAALKERLAKLEKELVDAKTPRLTPEQQFAQQKQAFTFTLKRYADLAGEGCKALGGKLLINIDVTGRVGVSCELR